jgi:hypothetical protein
MKEGGVGGFHVLDVEHGMESHGLKTAIRKFGYIGK